MKNSLIDGYEVVIGIEIHCQLTTNSKIFSPASTQFGAEVNTQANIIDLALPGVLPVLNKEAVRKAVIFGLGINADIGKINAFDRKNYFYPDLPKGYQISQMPRPIVGKGYIDVTVTDGDDAYQKRINITRAHLEEDAGKSVHGVASGVTGIDLNRAGTPLLEIVSEPDMRSTAEALAYIRAIHQLVVWLGISDAVMAEGSFRCDCNVSVRKPNAPFGTRCELKNLNSFRFIERAINVEIERQIDLIESGGKVVQATRLYNPELDETRAMRSKEEANDYRYFPDPDLLPVHIDDTTIQSLKNSLPELPRVRQNRFCSQYDLSEYDARVLTTSRALADFFEDTVQITGQQHAKLCANWIMGDLLGALNKNEQSIEQSPISAKQLALLIIRITDNTLSGKLAKQVFAKLWQGFEDDNAVDIIIEQDNLKQETDEGAILAMVQKVVDDNAAMVAEYQSGKQKAFNGLVGQVMKQSRGKANPAQVNTLLKKLIG